MDHPPLAEHLSLVEHQRLADHHPLVEHLLFVERQRLVDHQLRQPHWKIRKVGLPREQIPLQRQLLQGYWKATPVNRRW